MQNTKRRISAVPYYISLALMAYMPFHIFLAQSLSLVTGGLDAWKIAKDIVAIAAVLFVICSVYAMGRATKLFTAFVGMLLGYGALHALIWGVNADIYRDSALLGSVYNLRLPGFLILGYGATLLMGRNLAWRPIIRLILGVSTIVASIGLLQLLLPPDILTHAGYGIDRGARAMFFIDDKEGLLRIMSTLREPNALGAYLLLPTGLLTWLLTQNYIKRTKLFMAGALMVHCAAIAFTFSRSAWGGLLLVGALALLWRYRTHAIEFCRRFWLVGAAVLLLLAAGSYAVRDHHLVASYITHGSDDADLDSNDYHWLFFKQGIEGIVDQPLGHGPGTAGLASIQNPAGSFLTENYYVQVGYEVGIVGLLVFIAINAVVYVELWKRRQHGVAVALLAAFWAYVMVNMVLHIWANEAVACQWWILAGLALGLPVASKKEPTP